MMLKHKTEYRYPQKKVIDFFSQRISFRRVLAGTDGIFGKTYGANKYETTILCLALSEIATSKIQLFQIGEGGLTELPEKAREAIESLGKVEIYTSDRTIEKIDFEENDSLRSIEYVYNLLEKLGDK